MRRELAGEGRNQFIRWYSDRGRDWLAAKAIEHATRLEVAPAGVKVQDLGYRWGSCGKGNWLYFHWKTILLPRTIAEYVVIHELIHLHEPHHSAEFWRRVERAMPDYERRKQ
ncbi:MAG: M48 family metallopeptidase [Aquisalimonadaceae bacterium]